VPGDEPPQVNATRVVAVVEVGVEVEVDVVELTATLVEVVVVGTTGTGAQRSFAVFAVSVRAPN